MKITIEIDTGKLSAKLCRDALGTELRGLAVQAAGLVLMATDKLAHAPRDEIRPLFDSDGVACGRVEVSA